MIPSSHKPSYETPFVMPEHMLTLMSDHLQAGQQTYYGGKCNNNPDCTTSFCCKNNEKVGTYTYGICDYQRNCYID